MDDAQTDAVTRSMTTHGGTSLRWPAPPGFVHLSLGCPSPSMCFVNDLNPLYDILSKHLVELSQELRLHRPTVMNMPVHGCRTGGEVCLFAWSICSSRLRAPNGLTRLNLPALQCGDASTSVGRASPSTASGGKSSTRALSTCSVMFAVGSVAIASKRYGQVPAGSHIVVTQIGTDTASGADNATLVILQPAMPNEASQLSILVPKEAGASPLSTEEAAELATLRNQGTTLTSRVSV